VLQSSAATNSWEYPSGTIASLKALTASASNSEGLQVAITIENLSTRCLNYPYALDPSFERATDSLPAESVGRFGLAVPANRSGVYYTARPVSEADLILMRRIDELHLKHPFYGARRLAKQLVRDGFEVGRVHVTTLMRRMCIEALYRRPRTSIPDCDSLIYPYLLGGLKIDRVGKRSHFICR
jgi:HTH-like domain